MERIRMRGALRWALGGLLGLGLSFLSVQAAAAATLIVDAGGGGDCLTIQACVALAAPGDVIRIRSGVYNENVIVDKRLFIHGEPLSGPRTLTSPTGTNTTFTRRRCANREAVIVDGVVAGARGIGFQFDPGSDGSVLACLTIRQSLHSVSTDGAVVNSLSLEHVNGLGGGESPPPSAQENVDILGDRTLLYMDGFAGSGDGFDGVVVTGNNQRVIRVQASNMGQDCFEIDGDNNLIQQSLATDCSNADGFDIDGAAPRIVGSRADNVEGVGVQPTCTANCGQSRIESNESTRSGEDGFQIRNNEGGPGYMIVRKNQAVRNIEDGFEIAGSFITLQDNRSDANGTGHVESANIEVSASDSRILNNLARYGGNDGILVFPGADRNLIQGNKAHENAKDGIDIDGGSDNVIRNNQAINNEAEGLENNGANNRFNGNLSKGNRIDCANDDPGGLAAGSGGNSCADGSNFAVIPEIEVKRSSNNQGQGGNNKEDRNRKKKN